MKDHTKARPFTIEELRAYLVEVFPEFWKSGDLRVEDIAPDERDAAPKLSPQALAAGRHHFRTRHVRGL